jgi:hypothetical protein
VRVSGPQIAALPQRRGRITKPNKTSERTEKPAAEHTSVEKLGDDLCGGLKVSSNVPKGVVDGRQVNIPAPYGKVEAARTLA